jgi:hypothetical protein
MGELIVPIALLAISIFFYWDSGNLLVEDDGMPMTSATYPEFLSVMIMVCSAYLIIRFIIKHKQFIAEDRARYFDPRVLACFALFVVFYWVVPVLGYIPTAFAFLLLLSLFFQKEKRRMLDTVIMPACLSVGTYFAFYFMSIYLPTGTLFRGLF